MARRDKLVHKLLNLNGSFSWVELMGLLALLGFIRLEGTGSRVKFFHPQTKTTISLHRPHPGNQLKRYARRQVVATLIEGGFI